jgi:hypothetical protein
LPSNESKQSSNLVSRLSHATPQQQQQRSDVSSNIKFRVNLSRFMSMCALILSSSHPHTLIPDILVTSLLLLLRAIMYLSHELSTAASTEEGEAEGVEIIDMITACRSVTYSGSSV